MRICALFAVHLQILCVFCVLCSCPANDVQSLENVFLYENKAARNGFIACRLVAALPEGMGNGVASLFLLVAFGMELESYSFGSSCIGVISCVT